MNIFKALPFKRMMKSCHFRTFQLSLLLILFTVSCNAQNTNSTISLFDGITLEGWETVKEADQVFWYVEDSTIVGGDGKQKIPENTFLYTKKTYENFEFRCLFRLTGDHEVGLINSGIQYRSIVDGDKMVGYQADIGNGYWGDIYEENRRGKLMAGDLSTLRKVLDEDGWNSYIIRVKGDIHELYINGVKTGEYHEKDQDIPSKGVIGIQLHSGGNAKIEMKDISITHL
jgi:hypothetical protein